MSFISVFDVLGPNMIGPSSSHTAGAARIAYLAQKMINGPLVRVDFTLYGSFARTYRGHGTDRALLGGIMGFDTDDMRIRDSFRIAEEKGIAFCFVPNEEETYEELNSHLPANGDHVTTPEGLRGDVQSVNVLRQLVKVVVTLDNDEKEIREYPAAELKFKPRRKKKDVRLSKEEMKELKALEEKNGASKLNDD